MHTCTFEDPHTKAKYRLHYDGDASGDVILQVTRSGGDVAQFQVPFAALMQLIADVIRERRISSLEAAEPEELLGLLPPATVLI